MSQKQRGVLLINLGTPESPTPKAVKQYLAAFLGDKRVVDLPYLMRQILLRAVILPRRPKSSAKAYAKIWDPQRGSPLLFHTQDLAQGLQRVLGSDYVVGIAMRYGEPSIPSAIDRLMAMTDTLVVIPLFPQYADATTGSVFAAVFDHLKTKMIMPDVHLINHFYQEWDFIRCYADKIRAALQQGSVDRVLMSFHSLPVRQIRKASQGCDTRCFDEAPCASLSANNATCYRAQCYHTASQIMQQRGLESHPYEVVFQSRLGRIPWIGPDINAVLTSLAQQGDKRLLVACPSFVTDCLETLEEIQIRASATWKALGGESLVLVPSLNADPNWIRALGQIVLKRHSSLATDDSPSQWVKAPDYA